MGRKQSTTEKQDAKIFVERASEKTWNEISKEFGITISTAQRAYKRAEQRLAQDSKRYQEELLVNSPIGKTESCEIAESKSIFEKISNFFKGLFN